MLLSAPQDEGLDFVIVLLVEIAFVRAVGKAPASFDDFSLAEKIGALDGLDLVGCHENRPVSKILCQNSRHVARIKDRTSWWIFACGFMAPTNGERGLLTFFGDRF
jgi:hypothetical protein